jgi:hypothetical protein
MYNTYLTKGFVKQFIVHKRYRRQGWESAWEVSLRKDIRISGYQEAGYQDSGESGLNVEY